MSYHALLGDSELHEPKGMQPLTGGAADIGKVLVSKGDGTSEARKLVADEIDGLETSLLSGVYEDPNMSTQTVSVTTEGARHYAVGAAPTQVVSVQLPDPVAYAGEYISLKRLDQNAPDGAQVKFIPNAAETIDGMAEAGVTIAGNALVVVSDGTNWNIFASHLVNTGWELYADSTYGVGTELTVLSGVTTKLTIDGLGSLTNTSEKAPVAGAAWNTTTNLITQYLVGQMTMYRLFLYATPAAVNMSLLVEFKIAGSFTIAGQAIRFPSGAGVRQQVLVSLPIFADANSIANGIEINVTPVGGDVDIDSITIMSIEMHMPRGI